MLDENMRDARPGGQARHNAMGIALGLFVGLSCRGAAVFSVHHSKSLKGGSWFGTLPNLPHPTSPPAAVPPPTSDPINGWGGAVRDVPPPHLALPHFERWGT